MIRDPGQLRQAAAALLDRERDEILAATDSALCGVSLSRDRARAYADEMLREVISRLRGRGDESCWSTCATAGPAVHPMESLRITAALCQAVLLAMGNAPEDTPGAAGVVVTAVQALHRGATERLRRDFSSFTGFLINKIHDAHVEERSRIARELHDRIGYSLNVAFRNLELHDVQCESLHLDVDSRVVGAMEALRRAVGSVRGLTSELRLTEPLDSLEKALHNYLHSVDAEGVRTHLLVTGDESWVSPETLDEVFLVIREALRNAFAHASPTSVVVRVDIAPHELRATINDDGCGFDPRTAWLAGAAGLRSMKERAASIGGGVSVSSRPQDGTQVELVVPLAQSGGPDDPAEDAQGRTTILVVDDHVLVRAGLAEILQASGDLVVVGEAGDSQAAVAAAAEAQPDVVLLDIDIPGDDVSTTVRRLREVSPDSKVLILSMYDEPKLLRELLSLGISGYLLKSSTRQELVAAVQSARQDNSPILLAVSRQSLAQVRGETPGVLSDREREILELVAQAMSNSQIGVRLRISESTVKRHMHNIFGKLGAVSRIDAVNKAIAASLITALKPRSHTAAPRFPRM
jgi:DNA-binding NarL/FixJ family response regulator/signal transduction histidine kinase